MLLENNLKLNIFLHTIVLRNQENYKIFKCSSDSSFQEKKVEKIIIVSNKRCVQAVHLYRKYGFDEVPVDKEKFPFERADIAFEMLLEK